MLLSSHIFEMISFNLQIKNLQRRYHFLVVLNKYARYSTFLANSSTQTCINLVSIGNKFHPKCWLNIRYCPFSSLSYVSNCDTISLTWWKFWSHCQRNVEKCTSMQVEKWSIHFSKTFIIKNGPWIQIRSVIWGKTLLLAGLIRAECNFDSKITIHYKMIS